MSAPSVELTLEFVQDLKYLRLATAAARLVCAAIEDPDLPGSFVDEIELVVSEACTNAILHGAGTAAPVAVRFRLYGTALGIEVMDRGPGFDFEKVPEPNLDEHPEGGYGLYIIRKIMDEVAYGGDGTTNTLAMKRYFRKEGGFSS
jgi:serine/threonine-protein kinase RsbW